MYNEWRDSKLRLKDKIAIITGGSRGIGFAVADKFLKVCSSR